MACDLPESGVRDWTAADDEEEAAAKKKLRKAAESSSKADDSEPAVDCAPSHDLSAGSKEDGSHPGATRRLTISGDKRPHPDERQRVPPKSLRRDSDSEEAKGNSEEAEEDSEEAQEDQNLEKAVDEVLEELGLELQGEMAIREADSTDEFGENANPVLDKTSRRGRTG